MPNLRFAIEKGNYCMKETYPILGRRFAVKKKRKRLNFDILKRFMKV